MGIKRVLTGVVAFCSLFALASCDIEVKVKDTTKGKTTQGVTTTGRTKTGYFTTRSKTNGNTSTSNSTTANQTTNGGHVTTRPRPTTTKKVTTQTQGQTIRFYCWNDEFQSRFRKYYGDSQQLADGTDMLSDGTKIQWTMAANTGNVYQQTLDIVLENGLCDMFCFEADYAKKYVDSQYAVDLSTLGLNLSRQYQYVKDIATNSAGKIVGTSWQACPDVICYNENVAKLLFPTESDYSIEAMQQKLGTRTAFDATALQLESIDHEYAMIIGPYSWCRPYQCNLSQKMYNSSTKTITIDKKYFQYAYDTKNYNTKGYLLGDTNDYCLWGKYDKWYSGFTANSKALTVFSTTWFNDFIITEKHTKTIDDGFGNSITYICGGCPADENGGSPYRVVEGFEPSFWGGTWIAPTTYGVSNNTKKAAITSILSKMTTDKNTSRAISDEFLDFTNNIDAMDEKANDANFESTYFGGQNIYGIYSSVAKKISMANNSIVDFIAMDWFKQAFLPYIQGTKAASACWLDFEQWLKNGSLSYFYNVSFSDCTVNASSDVQIGEDITFI